MPNDGNEIQIAAHEDEIIVNLNDLAGIQEVLDSSGVSWERMEKCPRIGLALIGLGDLGHIPAEYKDPDAVSELDRLISYVKKAFADQRSGREPDIGKNRLAGSIEGSPYTGGGISGPYTGGGIGGPYTGGAEPAAFTGSGRAALTPGAGKAALTPAAARAGRTPGAARAIRSGMTHAAASRSGVIHPTPRSRSGFSTPGCSRTRTWPAGTSPTTARSCRRPPPALPTVRHTPRSSPGWSWRGHPTRTWSSATC